MANMEEKRRIRKMGRGRRGMNLKYYPTQKDIDEMYISGEISKTEWKKEIKRRLTARIRARLYWNGENEE